MPYLVTKDFSFDAGHRLAKGYVGKCAACHGHRYTARIELKCLNLDEFDMVFDFNDLNIIKEWVDENLDHSLLLFKDDPFYDLVSSFEDKQVTSRIFPCDANPTAEYLAQMLFEVSKILLGETLPQGVEVTKVTVWETPKCKAEFTGRI